MEFATTACAADAPHADDSYRIESNFCRSPVVKDFLAISVAAIVGANLRYLLSRLAARELGPIFPMERWESILWAVLLWVSSSSGPANACW